VLRSSTCILLALCLGACGSGAGEKQCPEPDTDIVLPQDEAPHHDDMEWWYYTGHLWTAAERRYGFELSFFQTFANGQVGYVGHFAVSDPGDRSHSYAQEIIAPEDVYPGFDLDVGDWNMQGDGTNYSLVADMNGYAVDLELVNTKPVAFHGERGQIEMGGDMLSYYYSKTRMDVTGTLTVDGRNEAVTGMAWHDHQWGDFDVFASNGWDWFSLQFDDGTELMIFLLHFKDSGTALTGGTFIDADGCHKHFTEFDLENLDSWVSPHTGGEYPLNWDLSVPDHGLEISITVTFDDQEMDCRATTLNTYWEGEVEVSGTRQGADVAGFGYVELAGYGPWGP